MKTIILTTIFLVLFSVNIFAQCGSEPTIEATGKILKKLKTEITKSDENEFKLIVKSSVKDASWLIKNAEAAVVTVFIDGKYNQDLMLFAGEENFEYSALLGKLDAQKKHEIVLVLSEKYSAPQIGKVEVLSAKIEKINRRNVSNFAYLATENAPVIYLRPDTIGRFSDIPLLTYYEIFDEPDGAKKIRYTTIFTNEDGGTNSQALLARWGRLTDIEWIYEMRVNEKGEILSQIIQGANHVTKDFQGKRMSSHPLILDATVNNNFSDAGCTSLKVSPKLVAADLSRKSRETVMDENAWTYRIMAYEAIRENRVNPAKLSANSVDDPRNYFYIEIESAPENAAVSIEIENKNGIKSFSDWQESRLRVNRTGFIRIAVRKPVELSADFPENIKISCSPTSEKDKGVCKKINVIKIVRLDKNYMPHEQTFDSESKTATSGETLNFPVIK